MNKVIGIQSKLNGDSARAYNRTNVLKFVLQSSGIDRTRLAEESGLTNAAMTKIVQELIDAKLLKEVGQLKTSGGRGRKRTGLAINETGGYVLGISILAFNSSIALTDLVGNTVDVLSIRPRDISNAQQTLDEVGAAVHLMIEKHKLAPNRVLGAGVAVAGYFDHSGDVLDSSPYLGWPSFNIRGSLANRLNLNITIDNVNRCIAVAESQMGSCVGETELVLIRAALGLGGAIINGGTILRGHNNQAGQIGHMPIDPKGLHCSCGARGCLNTVASGWAILNRLGLGNEEEPTTGCLESRETQLEKVLIDATAGESTSLQAISQAGEQLALHCVGMLHSLATQTVVLTGPLGRNESYCKAFKDTLIARGVSTKILTAHDQQITGPAPAASALALASHVYSPALDIQPLLEGAQQQSKAVPPKELLL